MAMTKWSAQTLIVTNFPLQSWTLSWLQTSTFAVQVDPQTGREEENGGTDTSLQLLPDLTTQDRIFAVHPKGGLPMLGLLAGQAGEHDCAPEVADFKHTRLGSTRRLLPHMPKQEACVQS